MGFPKSEKTDLGIDLLTALQILLGLVQLLDTLSVPLFETIHRGTVLVYFDLNADLTIPLALLSVCWVFYYIWRRSKLSFLVILPLILYPFLGLQLSLIAFSFIGASTTIASTRRFNGVLIFFLTLLSLIEVVSLLDWAVLLPLGIENPIGMITEVEFALFSFYGYLVPVLAMIFLFSWILRPLLDYGLGLSLIHNFKVSNDKIDARSIVVLTLALILSIEAAFYPYFGGVNPDNVDIGVDIPQYVRAVEEADGDFGKVILAGNGTRALALAMIMGLHELTGSDLTSVVRYLPALLNPILVLVYFMFSYQVFQNARIAEWSAFLGVCGTKVVVGMYSHFIANLLALIIILTSLSLLYRSQLKMSKVSFVASLVVGSLFVFIHPWTFMQYLGATCIALVFFYLLSRKKIVERFSLRSVIIYILVLIGSEIVKELLLPRSGGVNTLNVLLEGVTLLPEFWAQSIVSFEILFGGYLSNSLLFTLCIIGVYYLSFKRLPETQLWALLMVSSLVYIFGDNSIKGRLLFNIPLGIFEALGITILSQRYPKLSRSLTLFVVLSSLVYLFRSLANFIV